MAFDSTYTLYVKVRKPADDVHMFDEVITEDDDGMVVVKAVHTVGDNGDGVPGALENMKQDIQKKGFELVGETDEDAVINALKKD